MDEDEGEDFETSNAWRGTNGADDGEPDAQDSVPAGNKAAPSPWWGAHPGFAESLFPVWGSAREAGADFQGGHNVWGAVNTALALSDLWLGGDIAKGLAKGGFKFAGSNTWNATRKWMGKNGFLDAGQHGHHWLIPQSGWGKDIPDIVKNQPWNIKGMPSPEIHGRIHGNYGGRPQFNVMQQIHFGMPAWAKTAAGADTVRGGLFAHKVATGGPFPSSGP
jgi:hypothetical protein